MKNRKDKQIKEHNKKGSVWYEKHKAARKQNVLQNFAKVLL